MAKRGILLALILFILISSTFILAAENAPAETTENDCLYYFYGDGCKGCTETNEEVKLLQEKLLKLNIWMMIFSLQ